MTMDKFKFTTGNAICFFFFFFLNLFPQTFLFWINYLECGSRKFFTCIGLDMLVFPELLPKIIRKN